MSPRIPMSASRLMGWSIPSRAIWITPARSRATPSLSFSPRSGINKVLELLESIVAAVNADGVISGLMPGGFHLHEVPASKDMTFGYIESASSGRPNYNTGTIYVEDVTVDVVVEGKPKDALRAGTAIRQKFEDEGLTLSAG